MIRLRDVAEQMGVCKKTAARWAKRKGYAMEKRPVRGGWAWFVDADGEFPSLQIEHKRHSVNPELLANCIQAVELSFRRASAKQKAELIIKLYQAGV